MEGRAHYFVEQATVNWGGFIYVLWQNVEVNVSSKLRLVRSIRIASKAHLEEKEDITLQLLIRVKTKCILPCQFIDRLQSKLNDTTIHAISHRQIIIDLHETKAFLFFSILFSSRLLVHLCFIAVVKNGVFLGKEFIHFYFHLVELSVSKQEFGNFDQVRFRLVLGLSIFSLLALNLIVIRLN